MESVRFWLSPVVVGLIVSLCGVGMVKVSGLTPELLEPSPRPVIPTKPDPSPAQIERHAVAAAPSRAPVVVRTPAATPDPVRRAKPTAVPKSKPSSVPQRTAPPIATPRPTPKPSATPKPRHTRSTPPPHVKHKPPKPAPEPLPTLAGQIIDFTNWKLTLPTGPPGNPTEIRQPELARFAAPGVFGLNGSRTGVVFRAAAGGATTENSNYPRSELREMTAGGATEAGWSNSAGTHAMSITQAITVLPAAKPHVVAGQIHDADDDVIMIRLEGTRLFVEADGEDVGLLDPAYRLGSKFEVSIIAAENHLHVHYNGSPKVLLARTIEGAYFKAGCYTQSNPANGDSPTSYGEVVIYALTVRHS